MTVDLSSSDQPPEWLPLALAQTPEVQHVASGGVELEMLVWGPKGAPGLLLVHGAGAHAHWWAAVAPLVAQTHRVAAMSLAGSGGSGWRARYSSAEVFDDALACVAAAGLDDAGPPVFVGHSIGGAQLMHGALAAPETMGGLVLVDTSFRSPGAGRERPSSRRLFASEAGGVARFRLSPPGPARETTLVDFVARHALEPARGPDGEAGWRWRADPAYWAKFEPGVEQGPYAAPLRPGTRTVHMLAEHSHVAAIAHSLPLAENVLRMRLPACGHHAMLDRPLELAAALLALLAVWR